MMGEVEQDNILTLFLKCSSMCVHVFERLDRFDIHAFLWGQLFAILSRLIISCVVFAYCNLGLTAQFDARTTAN